MNDKDLVIFIDQQKALCDKHNGEYNSVDENSAVYTYKPETYDEAHMIYNNEEMMKWTNDNHFTWDPKWNKDTNSIEFRIKRLFSWNAREHFDKDLCKVLGVQTLNGTLKNDTKKASYDSMFSIYKRQFIVAQQAKQKKICQAVYNKSKTSKKLHDQATQMASMKMSMDGELVTYDIALKILTNRA